MLQLETLHRSAGRMFLSKKQKKTKTPQKANKHILKKVELFHEGFIDQQHTVAAACPDRLDRDVVAIVLSVCLCV